MNAKTKTNQPTTQKQQTKTKLTKKPPGIVENYFYCLSVIYPAGNLCIPQENISDKFQGLGSFPGILLFSYPYSSFKSKFIYNYMGLFQAFLSQITVSIYFQLFWKISTFQVKKVCTHTTMG